MAVAQANLVPRGEEHEVAAAQVDRAEFAVLYDRYVDAVFNYCLFRLWDWHDAEDATSLIFTRAFEALPRFKPSHGTFRSWLFTIAHNVVANAHRDRRTHRPLDAIFELPSSEPGPDEEAVWSDERWRLRAASQQLTDEQRQVVELRMAGLTGAEISAATGKSLAAVKMLQVRALDRLQQLLSAGEALR